MKEVYNVEIFELGYWQSIFTTDNLVHACREASFLTLNLREERIRILDGKNKEL